MHAPCASICRSGGPRSVAFALRFALVGLAGIALVACEGEQAALAARGPQAAETAALAWLLFGAGALILCGVMSLVALAARGPARARRALASERSILAGGVVLPVLTLSALLIHGLRIGATSPPAGDALPIRVTGQQWWWRVAYLDERGGVQFESANEIRIPVGRPVELELRSADVIHSFWVPSLAGKLDMIPGRTNRLRLRADRAGVYRGQCAEFCGGAHALMALYVIAEPEEVFATWRARQAQPAVEPQDPEARRGGELFLTSGCALCHRIGGTEAAGRIGPDLTHIGSRYSLASGLFPNHRGTLAAWIASARELKPENRMPSFDRFDGRELRSLAAYLDGLE
jgi:cytochrome c oxidase subunit 2